MRLIAEFTTEPFRGEVDVPPHAEHAIRVVRSSGLEHDFGPLGTTVSGEAAAVLGVVGQVLSGAFEHGAVRVTVQVACGDE